MFKTLLYALIFSLPLACSTKSEVNDVGLKMYHAKDTVEVIFSGLESVSAFELNYRNTFLLVDSLPYESLGLTMKLYKIGSWYYGKDLVPEWGDPGDFHLIEIVTDTHLYRIFNEDSGWEQGYYSNHYFPKTVNVEARKNKFFYEIFVNDRETIVAFTSYLYPSEQIPSRTLLILIKKDEIGVLFNENKTIVSIYGPSTDGNASDLKIVTSNKFPWALSKSGESSEKMDETEWESYYLRSGVLSKRSW